MFKTFLIAILSLTLTFIIMAVLPEFSMKIFDLNFRLDNVLMFLISFISIVIIYFSSLFGARKIKKNNELNSNVELKNIKG
ncbi:MAG TPA: hypothetical protein PKY81_13255 [bacterium]|nr:hypothetical protein [bacterium]HPN31915.1 hypothetical protein [bacterium]